MKEEILKKLLEYLQNTISFAQEQLPDIAKQIITFNIGKETTLFIAFFVLLIIGIGLIIYGIYDYKKRTDLEGVPYFMSGALAIIIGSLGTIQHFIELYKLYYAPKVFLIEYIKTIL